MSAVELPDDVWVKEEHVSAIYTRVQPVATGEASTALRVVVILELLSGKSLTLNHSTTLAQVLDRLYPHRHKSPIGPAFGSETTG